jgi:branched-chain amino acid transport system substrate-binding protein
MHRYLSCAIAFFLATSVAKSQELRIGFLNTTSGGLAIAGEHLERGWRLGLEARGWKKDGDQLGGVPTQIVFADDQAKPDVGVREVERFLRERRVQIIAGVLASNVMMAVFKPAFDGGALLVGANAGPTPLAGQLCNRLFVSTSFINDENAEATGALVSRDGVRTVVIMVPNYQSGRDNAAGFERTYTGGRVVERIYFKLNEVDFQADFAKVRSVQPEAVFLFAPGAMGVAFMKQWATSGLSSQIKLYSVFTIDQVTLPAIGDFAIGSFQSSNWNPSLDHPRNVEFIRSYVARYGSTPSFYAAQAYDAAGAIDDGVRAVNGRMSDMREVARAIRGSGLRSVRGDLRYNSNGFLVQPYWKVDVVKGGDGKADFKGTIKILERPDSYASKCPAAERI